jgi:hypothetical protein
MSKCQRYVTLHPVHVLLTNVLVLLSASDLAQRQLGFQDLLAGNPSPGAITVMTVDVLLAKTSAGILAQVIMSTTWLDAVSILKKTMLSLPRMELR